MTIKKQISIEFDFGDTVFLKTDTQTKRIVTGIILRPGGKVYELANGVECTWHQAVEIEKCPESTRVKGFSRK